MARSVPNSILENRTARLREPSAKEPYWCKVLPGLFVGYYRPNNTWWARSLKPGTKVYEKKAIGVADDHADANGTTVLTFYQAQAAARSWLQQLQTPCPAENRQPVTVEVAARHYMDWYQEHRKAVRETEYTIQVHILPDLGDKLVSDLRAPDLRKWHNKLATNPVRLRTRLGERQKFSAKPSTADEKRSRKATANRILTTLKAILNRAFHDELVADDTPWRLVKPFENADEPIMRFLTQQEATRLINACPADFRLMVQAGLLTGARYSELARIKVQNVHLDTGTIFIHPNTKSGKGRHVHLSAEGQMFYQDQITGKLGGAYVFVRADGKPWGKSHQIRPLLAACTQASIDPPISFHDLRHSYASFLANEGVDLLTISKLLGHSDTRMTSRHYAHLCDRTMAEAVMKLPNLGNKPDRKLTAIK